MTTNPEPNAFIPANKKSRAARKRIEAENAAGAASRQMAAAIYLRVSSEMQVDGFSIEAQKIACLKYAAEQSFSVDESHIYIDEAYSAKNEDRPAFQKMLMAAHSDEFKMIIIHKMDRFERNFRALRNTLEDLTQIGVRVYSIHENLELANTLVVNLLGVINEYYLQNLSDETAKGKHQAAKEGYFIGSRVPFGYRKWEPGDRPELDRRILIRDEAEAEALKTCFEMYASGQSSFADLAAYLNEHGFVSRSGRLFSADTLRSMLENPVYIGYVEYQGIHKDVYHAYSGKQPPLISEELFARVAKLREKRRNNHSRTAYGLENLKAKYLVQNLICCQSCGNRLRALSQKSRRIYRDYSAERGLECADSGKSVSAAYLDELVSGFLSAIILPRNWVDYISDKAKESDTVSEINAKIEKIRSRIQRRYEAYTVMESLLDFDKYEREQKADQNEIDELTQKLPKEAAAVNTQITLTTSLINLYARATKPQRYDIVHYLFRDIFYDFESKMISSFTPKPEFDFLFSTFAAENGWIRDGDRYLIRSWALSRQDRKSETGISGRQRAAMDGYFTNSTPPLGYCKGTEADPACMDSRILIIDEPAASAVQECFETFSAGHSTYSALARLLRDHGILNPSGKPFSREMIRLMLQNPVYIGKIVYKGAEYPGRHERIISETVWNAVQDLIRDRHRIG